MRWLIKYILIVCVAVWIGNHRYQISKTHRSQTRGSHIISSSTENITDGYQFYNRSAQNQDGYFEFKHTVYKHGLCGNMNIPPLQRPCTPYVHVHPYQLETFVLLQGHLSYRLDTQNYSCDVHTCPVPIVIRPLVSHTFWMNDNKEDLVLIVRIEPAHRTHGLRAESFENIVGSRRDNALNIWQAFVFIENIETYPVFLPLFFSKLFIKTGSFIGHLLLGYQIEYDEYTTRNL